MKTKDWTGGKQSLVKTLCASNHTDKTRVEHDFYATDPKAARMLMEIEQFNFKNTFVFEEPACGEGHIVEGILEWCNERDICAMCHAQDLVDRGYGKVEDFLTRTRPIKGHLITNPPYRYAKEFVEQALRLIKPGFKVMMFLKILFLEGQKRGKLFKQYPPTRVWVSSSRLVCAANGDFSKGYSSAAAYGWFVWEAGFSGTTQLFWFN